MQNQSLISINKTGAYAPVLFSVVIVTYNSAATIIPCLTSILSSSLIQNIEIAVVDNASQDATTAQIKSIQAYAKCSLILIENCTNRGFTAASNQGVRITSAPYVVFLNPDTVMPPHSLLRLKHHLTDPSVAAVGPISNFAAGRQSVAVHWYGTLPEAASPEQAAEFLYETNKGKSEETKLLIGFCLMVHRHLLQELGALDERLFLGADDLELSWRLRSHRYRLLIATDCFVYHEGQHSFKTEPAGRTAQLVQESHNALYLILEESYGADRVPVAKELWDIDWFTPDDADFNPLVRSHQLLCLPHGTELEEPLVSIIILTWNQLEYTKECLEAIALHTNGNYELIIVDNGSDDGTVPWLQEQAKSETRLRLILNQNNRGFAAGCNQGLAKAKGDWLLLLNNDVVVTSNWLDGLLQCHQTDPNAGIVGPLTNNASGIQGIAPIPYTDAKGLERFARELRRDNRHRRIFLRRLVGFCMLFKRTLYQQIGGLDEQFGTGNYEDDDFCLRSAIAGFRNIVAADTYVHHHGSVSFKGGGINYRAVLSGNWALFRNKWSAPVSDPDCAKLIAACRMREDAEKLLQLQKYEDAFTILTKAHMDFPSDLLLRRIYARVLATAGKFSEAASLGDRLAAAQCLLDRHQIYPAEQLLFTLLTEEPGFGEAHMMLSELLCNIGEIEYANALLVYSFRLSPVTVAENLLRHPDKRCIIQRHLVEDAARLNPDSKAVSALYVLTAGEAHRQLEAAELYIRNFGLDPEILELGLLARRNVGIHRKAAYEIPRVSLCMIIKDEERHLAECILSCRPLVSQIVVVDTGSKDRSVQIAELFGGMVLHYKWCNDFSAARNYGIAAATGDWILIMDADERLSLRDYDLFCRVLNQADCCAFTITTRNYCAERGGDGFVALDGAYPEEEAGIGWTGSDKIRLFPNGYGIRFEGVVHELVEDAVSSAGLTVHQHPVPVHHYGGLETARLERKKEEYYRLGLCKLADGERTPKALYELAVQAGELGKYSEAIDIWLIFLQQESDYAPAWFNLGYVCLRAGQIRESLTASERALQLKSYYPAARVNRAICRFLLQPDSSQLGLLAQELKELPDQIPLRVLFSLAQCLAGAPEQGLKELRLLHQTGNDPLPFLSELCCILKKKGKTAEGRLIELVSVAIGGSAGQAGQ